MPEGELTPASLGWWRIHGSTLLLALHEVHEGGHPDVVYAELYANADICSPEEPDEDD